MIVETYVTHNCGDMRNTLETRGGAMDVFTDWLEYYSYIDLQTFCESHTHVELCICIIILGEEQDNVQQD